MTPTSLNEASLEYLIMSDMTGVPVGDFKGGESLAREVPDRAYDADWTIGSAAEFARAHVVDTKQLFAFLDATQPEIVSELGIGHEGHARTQFLNRLQAEVTKLGVIDVPRINGIFGQLPDTLRDVWIDIARHEDERAAQLITGLKDEHPFNEKYDRIADVDWESCSVVLDAQTQLNALM